ncbi:MAG: hypothetical protein ACE5PM_03395 [Candidatus Hydrothermarchaeales archaeon]
MLSNFFRKKLDENALRPVLDEMVRCGLLKVDEEGYYQITELGEVYKAKRRRFL